MAKMRVRPSAPGTKAYTIDTTWCVRQPRKRPTVDQERILLGTLRFMMRDEPDRIVRDTTVIASGVRRRRKAA